mgnify:CR=1 FL=1
MKKLNVGCGEDYKEGWINLDHRKNVKVDVRHDLNAFPYPFKDNEIAVCYVKNALAFLRDPIRVLKELSRITRKKGKIIVHTPHAISYAYVSGLGHTHHFTENTFNEHAIKEFELEKLLRLRSIEFVYNNRWKKFIPFKKYLKIFLRGLYDDIQYEFEVTK